MKRPNIISSLWMWHSLCCLLCILACIPILWPQVFLPDAWEQRIISYSGGVVLVSFGLSLLLVLSTTFLMLLRLRNLRALWYALSWAAQWGIAFLLFSMLAWLANVPVPGSEKLASEPIQRTDTLYTADATLTGPNSLLLIISPEPYSTDSIQPTPNLTLLEENHADLLQEYIDSSTRWAAYTSDDTFYTKPGHVVMTPPAVNGGIHGLVHVAFRRLVEGEPLPSGYSIVKPGAPMPTTPEGSEQVADLAVDLGRNHYLLLAWRGTSHADTAHRAMNAAIATVDAMVQPLVDKPTSETVQQMLVGKLNMVSDKPEILLSQPPSQYGTYQAEIYANPGEAGTLMLRVEDLATGETLRLFTCQAYYSADPGELFRHDIPGMLPEEMRSASFGHVPDLLPAKAPLFIVRRGESHQFFGVAIEVVFTPVGIAKPRRVLLRRCYRVQAYDGALLNADTPDELIFSPPSSPSESSPTTEQQEPPAPAPEGAPAPEAPAAAPQEPAPAPAEKASSEQESASS